MIIRQATDTLLRLARSFPVVVITGPRQSGKTTLSRSVFATKEYVSLENPDEREFAQQDPKRFLQRFKNGAILDEVQRSPALLSYMQQVVDERKVMGDFILTGSAQLELVSSITQSLAGRVGRIELLPLAQSELIQANKLPNALTEMLFQGSYPAVYDREISTNDWYTNYVATYLERDVRQLIAVRDLVQFQRFVKMCAARSGQLLNLASLGADCGISAVTAREWLTVLEACYLVTRIMPYHQNFGKRLVKTPKLYFLDVGLMSWLLGITEPKSLETHAMRGPIFETYIVSELLKQRYNQGQANNLYFWRDNVGHEVDIVYETAQGLQAIEMKSGSTFAPDWPIAINKWCRLAGNKALTPIIIYGGNENYERENYKVISWKNI